jgi:hypothetical protein
MMSVTGAANEQNSKGRCVVVIKQSKVVMSSFPSYIRKIDEAFRCKIITGCLGLQTLR